MEVHGVHHVCMAVDDLERAVETYSRLFGAEVELRGRVEEQGVDAVYLRVGGGPRRAGLAPAGGLSCRKVPYPAGARRAPRCVRGRGHPSGCEGARREGSQRDRRRAPSRPAPAPAAAASRSATSDLPERVPPRTRVITGTAYTSARHGCHPRRRPAPARPVRVLGQHLPLADRRGGPAAHGRRRRARGPRRGRQRGHQQRARRRPARPPGRRRGRPPGPRPAPAAGPPGPPRRLGHVRPAAGGRRHGRGRAPAPGTGGGRHVQGPPHHRVRAGRRHDRRGPRPLLRRARRLRARVRGGRAGVRRPARPRPPGRGTGPG